LPVEAKPIVPSVLLTTPPALMSRLPVPLPPILRKLLLLQLEPVSATVTLPLLPELSPMIASVLLTAPPALMARLPMPTMPSMSLLATAPVAPTCAVPPLSMFALSAAVGTELGMYRIHSLQFIPETWFTLLVKKDWWSVLPGLPPHQKIPGHNQGN
jgi:hypothetical protein